MALEGQKQRAFKRIGYGKGSMQKPPAGGFSVQQSNVFLAYIQIQAKIFVNERFNLLPAYPLYHH